MGYVSIHGNFGIQCPYNNNLDRCNEKYGKIRFTSDIELKRYLKYGIIPGQLRNKFIECGDNDIVYIIKKKAKEIGIEAKVIK